MLEKYKVAAQLLGKVGLILSEPQILHLLISLSAWLIKNYETRTVHKYLSYCGHDLYRKATKVTIRISSLKKNMQTIHISH